MLPLLNKLLCVFGIFQDVILERFTGIDDVFRMGYMATRGLDVLRLLAGLSIANERRGKGRRNLLESVWQCYGGWNRKKGRDCQWNLREERIWVCIAIRYRDTPT